MNRLVRGVGFVAFLVSGLTVLAEPPAKIKGSIQVIDVKILKDKKTQTYRVEARAILTVGSDSKGLARTSFWFEGPDGKVIPALVPPIEPLEAGKSVIVTFRPLDENLRPRPGVWKAKANYANVEEIVFRNSKEFALRDPVAD